MRVFVTDASYKHTLSAVRSLGRKNIEVITGSSSRYALAFYSKYCRKRVVYPPLENTTHFIRAMDRILKNNKINVILPIGYQATALFSQQYDHFSQYAMIPIAQKESIRIAGNKDATLQLAEQLGIRIPKYYKSIDEVNQYPVVLKGIKGAGQIRYINSQNDLNQKTFDDLIIQEYIPGEGFGFFALYNQGELRAFFMHHRIREYPFTGGPSTTAESVYDPKLKELGVKLLDALKWHGVAMVEFKKDARDGKFTLMEINPKFWGSLDLAIVSGVDFPYLTVKMAIDGDIQPIRSYFIGKRFQWLFPDEILHLTSRPQSFGSVLSDFVSTRCKNNIMLSDIKPNIYQICQTAREIITRSRKDNLRFPHGIPAVRLESK